MWLLLFFKQKVNAKNTALRQRSVKTQYFGVWHALFKLSCANGEKSENSCTIQQEMKLRNRYEKRDEHATIVDPTVQNYYHWIQLKRLLLSNYLSGLCQQWKYVYTYTIFVPLLWKKENCTLSVLLNLSNSCIFFCCYTDLPEDLQLKTWKSKFTQASNPYFTLFLQLIEFNGSHVSVCLDEK